MAENWFTIAAQIVNFLILLGLLKHFLYGPIVNVMEQRQERISSRMDEANRQIQRAEEEEQKYRAQRRELEKKREALLDQAQKEAEQRRQELLQEIREEVHQAEQSWHRAIERDREMFLRDLREKVARETLLVSRQILDDLADAELEHMIIETFIDRLEEVEAERWDDLISAARAEDDGLVVQTTFDIPSDLQSKLSNAIREHVGEGISISYRETDELLGGIQIRSSGLKVAWSIDDYLEGVHERIEEMIDEEVDASDG